MTGAHNLNRHPNTLGATRMGSPPHAYPAATGRQGTRTMRRNNPPMTSDLHGQVMDRAQGRCEAGVPGVCTRRHPSEAHHRQLRSGGGRNVVENLAGICHLCHDWVHKHPAEARENGWIVSKYVADPGQVPMRRHGRDVYLTADGWFEQVAA